MSSVFDRPVCAVDSGWMQHSLSNLVAMLLSVINDLATLVDDCSEKFDPILCTVSLNSRTMC